jgi:hypothetical protein
MVLESDHLPDEQLSVKLRQVMVVESDHLPDEQ